MNEFIALIVDDDTMIQMLLQHALKPITGKVFVTDSLVGALEIVTTQPMLHIITLDLSMPGSTVENVLSSIGVMRARHPQCSIIIMSGHCAPAIEGAGADAIVDKCKIEGLATGFLCPLLQAMYAHSGGDQERIARLDELMEKLFPNRGDDLPCALSRNCQTFHAPMP